MSNTVDNLRSFIEEDQFSRKLCPADGTLFFVMEDDKLLFFQDIQKIFKLNDLAAYIWCLLEDRRSLSEISEALIANGMTAEAAREHLSAAIEQWLQIGALSFDSSDADWPAYTMTLDIAGFGVRMEVESEALKDLLTLVFAQFVCERELPGCTLKVIEINKMVCVLRDKANIIYCPVFELAACVKAYLIQQILDRRVGNVAFHSAMLVRDGEALLISGPPGAGKSTLTARMLKEGYEYAGDDVVLIAPNGDAEGLPFPITLKSGSWNLINRFYPELDSLPVHSRPDSMKLRFLRPAKIARAHFPVAWCIFIRRTDQGDPSLTPLSKSDALQRLIESSYSAGEKLTLELCLALRQTITQASSFELTYSNLESARKAIMSACHA